MALEVRASDQAAPRFLSVVVVPDLPPARRVVAPGTDIAFAAPAGRGAIGILSGDDLGLTELSLRFTMASGGGEAVSFPVGEVPLRVERRSARERQGHAQIVLDGLGLAVGDILVGVPSSGLHTNGYSLARRIVFETLKLSVDSYVPELQQTVGDALLAPHRSYLPVIRPLLDATRIKGMAHITGGGITDNLPRILPHGTAAVIDGSSWPIPPLFAWLRQSGDVPIDDMMRTFNMGIGLVVVVARDQAEPLISELAARGGRDARVIGEIVPGEPPAVTYSNLA